jgi:hypothetical protein
MVHLFFQQVKEARRANSQVLGTHHELSTPNLRSPVIWNGQIHHVHCQRLVSFLSTYIPIDAEKHPIKWATTILYLAQSYL